MNSDDSEKIELIAYIDTMFGRDNFDEHYKKLQVAISNMCPKEVFVTESDAKYRLNHIKNIIINNKNKHKIPLRTYKCDICGYWHLTSKPNSFQVEEIENLNNNDKEYEPVLKSKWEHLMNS